MLTILVLAAYAAKLILLVRMGGMTAVYSWHYNLMAALSRVLNAIANGDPAETLSSRTGKSIRNQGWAASYPWPDWLKAHFLATIDDNVGHDTVSGRTTWS